MNLTNPVEIGTRISDLQFWTVRYCTNRTSKLKISGIEEGLINANQPKSGKMFIIFISGIVNFISNEDYFCCWPRLALFFFFFFWLPDGIHHWQHCLCYCKYKTYIFLYNYHYFFITIYFHVMFSRGSNY